MFVTAYESPASVVATAMAKAAEKVLGHAHRRLWDIDDIAFHTNYQPRTVREIIVKQRGFPKPVRVLKREARWFPAEVEQWFLSRQDD